MVHGRDPYLLLLINITIFDQSLSQIIITTCVLRKKCDVWDVNRSKETRCEDDNSSLLRNMLIF